MKNLFDIKDNVVVITGGTGVLGRAIAIHLADQGAKVVIMGRKAEVGNEIVKEIKENGGEAMFLVTDVMNREILEQNLADILAAYGRVDALLNAAGGNMPGATVAPTGTFFDLKIEEFQRVLDLNLTGTVLPTQVFLKPMVEQNKGAIVNFSSQAARDGGGPGASMYATAKAAVMCHTRSMAKELGPQGIRVNALAPGMINTSFHDRFTKPEARENLHKTAPLRREGTAMEIADLVCFLACDESSYITGASIDINGGVLFS